MAVTIEKRVQQLREAEQLVERRRTALRRDLLALIRAGEWSEREAARVTGLSRMTIRKWLDQTG